MSSMTDYLEVELRKHLFRTGSYTKPTVMAVALFTAAPSDAGGGTEVSGGSYARVDRPPLDANWSGASSTSGATDNVAVITFPTASANWGTITHVALFDATSGGNMLFWGALAASKVVNTGDTFSIAAGDLDIVFA